MGKRKLVCLWVFFALVVGSCKQPEPVETPASTLHPSSTTVPASATPGSTIPAFTPSPANTLTSTFLPSPTARDWSLMHALASGAHYSDAVNDIPISFLDVTGFEASVDEEHETVQIVLSMGDIPEQVEHGRIENSVEYAWQVHVFLKPETTESSMVPDATINIFTFTMTSFQGETPVSGTPGTVELVPFSQLFSSTSITIPSGESIGEASVTADPDSNTLTLQARIPGVTGDSLFSFETEYFNGSFDSPDYSLLQGTPFAPTPDAILGEHASGQAISTTAAPAAGETGILIQAASVRAFPGPDHYDGDILTLEIYNGSGSTSGTQTTVSLILDGGPPNLVNGKWFFDKLFLPLALDLSGKEGFHELEISGNSSGPTIDATYRFTVLPASMRPAQEDDLEWVTRITDCCNLHYISNTAAARDIEAISKRSQEAYHEFETKTGAALKNKMEVYLIDRMWGNGAFGGGGELIVSYTDRYYGPSIGLEGIKTLLLHEFTHAAAVDVGDQGFALYNEGLAVFIAGGHYKPEPIRERGAALYQLGYFVPVGETINQHELLYLYGAALYQYISNTYELSSVWKFVKSTGRTDILEGNHLDTAVQNSLGISLGQLTAGFENWLSSEDPGDQLQDLKITIELQDLRRLYQDTYAPPPGFIFGKASEYVASPEFLPALVREADDPPHATVEVMIAAAQEAAAGKDYDKASEITAALRSVIDSGSFSNPLAAQYLKVVEALWQAGYQALSVDLNGDTAAQAIGSKVEPETTIVNLQQIDGSWKVVP